MTNAEAVRLLRDCLRRGRKPTRVVVDERRKPAKAVVTFDDGTAIAWCPATAPRWFLQYWKQSAARIKKSIPCCPPHPPIPLKRRVEPAALPWWFDCQRKWPRSTL
jgi:hypothetical protein